MAKVGFQEAFQVWLRKVIFDSEIEIEGLYSTWADKDSEFPYLVYKLENNDYQPNKVMSTATLTIDIWDYAQLERNVLQIRDKIVALLDGRLVSEQEIADIFANFEDYDGDNVVSAFRIELASENSIPTDTMDVWRRELQFDVRYDRKRDISNILDRENEKPLWDLS